MKRAIPLLVGTLAGCAQTPPPEAATKNPVVVVTSDFCEVMKGVLPPTGKPVWGVKDDPRTIHAARKVGAAVDARCNSKPASKAKPS